MGQPHYIKAEMCDPLAAVVPRGHHQHTDVWSTHKQPQYSSWLLGQGHNAERPTNSTGPKKGCSELLVRGSGLQTLEADSQMLKDIPTSKHSLPTTFLYDMTFEIKAILKTLMLTVPVLFLECCNDRSNFFFKG
jgi:hypothetical protein